MSNDVVLYLSASVISECFVYYSIISVATQRLMQVIA